ncbi:MAG TPA: hypothetical protein PLC80_15745 [Draconibacterium sp.]|nr:hypothetical protein [Draconibacterium sp.]
MKKITSIILLFTAVLISSCEGPVGPPGQDGEALIGTIFEMQGDFKASNNYELYFNFPNNFEIYDTDVVLVYILWETTTVNGNQTDVWRLMPQSRFIDNGVIQYNFDHTVNDVRVFLETTFDYGDLLPSETDDQIFRIAVLPADFMATKKSAEINDLNILMNSNELIFNVIKK